MDRHRLHSDTTLNSVTDPDPEPDPTANFTHVGKSEFFIHLFTERVLKFPEKGLVLSFHHLVKMDTDPIRIGMPFMPISE